MLRLLAAIFLFCCCCCLFHAIIDSCIVEYAGQGSEWVTTKPRYIVKVKIIVKTYIVTICLIITVAGMESTGSVTQHYMSLLLIPYRQEVG